MLGKYWALIFGWRPGPWTNRSAGVGVFFDSAFFRPCDVCRVLVPPSSMAGRGGLVRVCTRKADITLLPTYAPP
eukprot:7587931-Lingulodinium_polyedra.AAC.1